LPVAMPTSVLFEYITVSFCCQGRSNEFESGEATSGNLFVFHGSENYSVSNLHAYASVETDRKQIQCSTKKNWNI